jgi:hypothetical protein
VKNTILNGIWGLFVVTLLLFVATDSASAQFIEVNVGYTLRLERLVERAAKEQEQKLLYKFDYENLADLKIVFRDYLTEGYKARYDHLTHTLFFKSDFVLCIGFDVFDMLLSDSATLVNQGLASELVQTIHHEVGHIWCIQYAKSCLGKKFKKCWLIKDENIAVRLVHEGLANCIESLMFENKTIPDYNWSWFSVDDAFSDSEIFHSVIYQGGHHLVGTIYQKYGNMESAFLYLSKHRLKITDDFSAVAKYMDEAKK